MNIGELIEDAKKRTGWSYAALSRHLQIDPALLNRAKKGTDSLPISACGKLAEIVEMDKFSVAAMAALMTEKSPARKEYLIKHVISHAACIGFVSIAGLGLLGPSDVRAATDTGVRIAPSPPTALVPLGLSACQAPLPIVPTIVWRAT